VAVIGLVACGGTDEEIIAATTDAAKKQQLSRRTARELIDCDAIAR